MKQKICFLALLCLFFGLKLRGQGLGIGDRVPDVMVRNIAGLRMEGKAVDSVRLSAFAGKLLILDFWATWCAPCRKMVPVMDSLQRVFKDEVQFLPVSYETAAVVAPVLAAMRKVKAFDLPEVTGDVALNRLFPHRSLPHYVWINGSGVVVGITEEKEVNAGNIRRALDGSRNGSLGGSLGGGSSGGGAAAALGLAVKHDSVIAYDRERPLFAGAVGSKEVQGAVVYRSVLSGFVPGLEAGMDVFPFDPVRGRHCNVRNVPLTWLFRMAYSDQGRWFSGAFMRLLTRDSLSMRTRLSGQAYEAWLGQGHGWCYELQVPPALAGGMFALMQQDVARLFPQYRAGVEKVRARCLVLVRTSRLDKLRSVGGGALVEAGPFSARLRNTGLGQLIKRLQVQYLEGYPLPVIDGTGYGGAVDLSLDAPLNDVAAMNRELARYDLRFVEKDADVALLVVRDADRLTISDKNLNQR